MRIVKDSDVIGIAGWLPRSRRPPLFPFVREGFTGVLVDCLPPRTKCVKNDADEAALEPFVEGIQRIQQFSRVSIRGITAENFSAPLIVDQIVQSLGSVRERPS